MQINVHKFIKIEIPPVGIKFEPIIRTMRAGTFSVCSPAYPLTLDTE